MISGEVHYGWARLNETCAKNGENFALLTGYAYETVPNQGIITGRTKGKLAKGQLEDKSLRRPGARALPDSKTGQNPVPPQAFSPTSASLGHLAKGAPGLRAWRQREKLVKPPDVQ